MPTPVPSVKLQRKIIESPLHLSRSSSKKTNHEKGLNKLLQKKSEELDTAPVVIIRTVMGGLRHIHNITIPVPYLVGNYGFGRGITISGII